MTWASSIMMEGVVSGSFGIVMRERELLTEYITNFKNQMLNLIQNTELCRHGIDT